MKMFDYLWPFCALLLLLMLDDAHKAIEKLETKVRILEEEKAMCMKSDFFDDYN